MIAQAYQDLGQAITNYVEYLKERNTGAARLQQLELRRNEACEQFKLISSQEMDLDAQDLVVPHHILDSQVIYYNTS